MAIDSSESFYGEIIFFSKKGYGFISWIKDEKTCPDLFLHFSDIIMENGGFKIVKKGDKVKFQIGLNNRSEPKAINCYVIK